jgi:alpha-glucosidase
MKGGFLNELSPRAPGEGEYEIKERPKACGWWNGYSAFLDFSHPNANAWFTETLDGLVRDFGVDGFKLDGADLGAYNLSDRSANDPKATSGSLNNGYCEYAVKYPFSEIRNTWRFQLKPVVVRLHDKMHEWPALDRIVADMIAAGLLGHPFICPDMVGGGDWIAFIPGSPFDPELFIRSAQVHALCPMMQISASPWRVLDAKHQAIFSDIVALRQKFAAKFAALAQKAGEDGEPILRSLEYNYPAQGYHAIIDQFMMGEDLLVAPVLKKGAASRKVVLPPGRWLGDDGRTFDGPASITVETPLQRLPHFTAVR